MNGRPREELRDQLVLFYPVRDIGGSQLAFARIGRELAKRPDWRVIVVDFEDGFLRRTLTAWGVEFSFISWRPEAGMVYLGEAILLLSLSNLPYSLQWLRTDNTTRVLFWSLHPHAILALFRFGFLYNRLPFALRQIASRALEPITWSRVRRLLTNIEQAGGVVYMDGPNSRFPLSLGYQPVNTHYLPVPIEQGRSAALLWDERISIGWLGRLARDKSYTICAMLEMCSRYAVARDVEIDFHIVGDGPVFGRLQKLRAPGVRLHFPGALREQALADYFGANVKVGFAMGTSLLEIASLGIPTLVGDYSNDPIPCDKLPLRWFVPNEEYSLGEVLGERPRRAEVEIAEVVRLCGDFGSVRALGQRCREYAKENHRIDYVTERLVGYLRATRYCFESARPVAGDGERAWGPHLSRLFHRQQKPNMLQLHNPGVSTPKRS